MQWCTLQKTGSNHGVFLPAMESYASEQYEPTYCTYILPSAHYLFIFPPIEDHESYCVTQRLGPQVQIIGLPRDHTASRLQPVLPILFLLPAPIQCAPPTQLFAKSPIPSNQHSAHGRDIIQWHLQHKFLTVTPKDELKATTDASVARSLRLDLDSLLLPSRVRDGHKLGF